MTETKQTSKTSFILYNEYWDCLEGLDHAAIGKIFEAVFKWRRGEQINITDPTTKVAFNFIKNQIIRDEEKYKDKINKRSQAGKKGGAPKGNSNACKNNLNQPTREENNQNQAKQASSSKNKQNKLNENENENENVNDIYISNKFEMAKAISPQAAQGEGNLSLNGQSPSPSAPPPRPDKRSPQIEKIMAWFEVTYGFPPTDRKPRFRAQNLVQRMRKFCQECGKDPTPERIGKAISQFLDWYADNQYHDGTQTLDTVVRKFEVWKAEVLERRKEGLYA